jgi:hypothetical protein
MAIVTRFHIEDLNGRFWTGAEFSRDEDIAEEYRDEQEAIEAAIECGGEVVEFQRPGFDLPRAPAHFSIAAE